MTAFDTLTAARRIKDAGMEAPHAEAVAEAVRDATGADREHMATKADLKPLATRAELSALETRIAASERRVFAVVIAAAGVLFAALRLIPA